MYFEKSKTVEEVKNRYRLLSKRFHPDLGGDNILMQELNEEYKKALEELNNPLLYRSEIKHKKTSRHYDNEEKIRGVQKWAEYQMDFDSEFIDSLEEKVNRGWDLTSRQEEALDNVIKKFRINIGDWL